MDDGRLLQTHSGILNSINYQRGGAAASIVSCVQPILTCCKASYIMSLVLSAPINLGRRRRSDTVQSSGTPPPPLNNSCMTLSSLGTESIWELLIHHCPYPIPPPRTSLLQALEHLNYSQLHLSHTAISCIYLKDHQSHRELYNNVTRQIRQQLFLHRKRPREDAVCLMNAASTTPSSSDTDAHHYSCPVIA